MAKSEFTLAFNEIAELRKLPKEVISEALRQALISAYRRDTKASSAQRIEAEVDLTTNLHKIFVEKEVVQDVDSESTEVALEKARSIEPGAQLGDMVMVPIEYNIKDFGRIAAQTAKQVISQKIRDAERNQLYDEFKNREGELVTGTIQSVSPQQISLTIDRAEAIMPRKEMIPGERYRQHEKIRILIAEVKKSTREPQIIVSRGHRNLLRRLLEYEVPEIYNRQVEIKNIAREAGHRSKVAVAALQPGVDPLGACVGVRGSRIQNIVKELNDEKIDVIPWDVDQAVFISKALSPARVTGVYLEEDIDQGRTAVVIVPDDQLSLAIGKEGQNARLAAKLTGWRIDIKSVTEAAFQALPRLEEPPLDRLATELPDMLQEVHRILDKKKAERPVTPEEYTTLARFVQMSEQRLLDQREIARNRRKKAMDRMRSVVPPWAFSVPLTEIDLPDPILQALKNVENCGDLMLRVQADTEKLSDVLKAARLDSDALDVIKDALTDLLRNHKKEEELAAAQPVEAPAAPVAEVSVPAAEVQTAPISAEGAPEVAADEEEAPPAFVDVEPAAKAGEIAEKPRMRKIPKVLEAEPVKDTETEEASGDEGDHKGKKKGKNRGRELVFDETRGQMVAKRKRKGGRDRGFGWGDDDV